MSTEQISWLINEINTSRFTVDHAGLLRPPALWVTESKSGEKPNGLTLTSAHKFWSPVRTITTGATEVIQGWLTNGSTRTTSPTKPALLTKPTVMTMASDVLLKLNARTASHKRDAGHRKEQKSTELKSSDSWLVRKTSWTKFSKEVQSHALLPLQTHFSIILEVSLWTKLVERSLTTTFQSLAGVNKTEQNTGSSGTHGEAIGVREETSDWSEALITSALRPTAPGAFHLTLGQTMSEMRPNQKLKTWNQSSTFKFLKTSAKDNHQRASRSTSFHRALMNTWK